MEISRMAAKKIERLQGLTNIDEFESDFKSQILFNGIDQNHLGVIVDSDTLDVIITRCEKYYIDLIGVETNIDSDIPYYDLTYEDYVAKPPGSSWCKPYINELIRKYGPIPLIFHIDITELGCVFLKILTGIPFNLFPTTTK